MGDDRVSWSGRTMECFNVNNGKAYLSPVRANEDNTCFYRALCDSLDARARVMTKFFIPFTTRFSIQKLIEREVRWLTDPNKRVEDCLAYYKRMGHSLPTHPHNSEVNFIVNDY
ncbi:hypothetical protein LINPERPRIM_LOCUS9590 [Linum perenne]